MVDFHDSVYTKNKGVARRAGGEGRGDRASPEFGSSVDPIQARGDRF